MRSASGSATSITDIRGKVFEEVHTFCNKIGYQIRLATMELEYIIMAPRACCDTYTLDHIEGDLDDLVGHPILASIEFDGAQTLATEKGSVTFNWLSKKFGHDLRGIQVFKRRIHRASA